ncbi:helix-turn-helix domain-containing protein [Raoultibacter timonensis]|uniref:HTH luxR-type domain-containing protein n=1 Tax=Raoultibacter timonensis TaxID=1907662 RepID=A0ABN6MIR0_9ACTN|nr:helix-turn-helix transcriptional regulator [Raoultibacter timonensis]BDE97877.1 hypothetical protein CE91St30_32100 [Raoultibacter timonensis]BDF52480.1 hypothetical protein CE91St31_32100 [Raoultibacter timonensis]
MTDEVKKRDSDRLDGAIPESIYGVMAAIAFMLYCSFLITTLIFPVKTQDEVGSTLTVLPAFCGLFVFAGAQLLAIRGRSRAWSHRRNAPLVLSALLTVPLLAAMAAASFDLQASLLLQAAAWALWGLGQAIFFPMIGSLQAEIGHTEENRKLHLASIGGAVMCASVFGALALFAPDPLRSFLPALYFATTLIIFVAIRTQRRIEGDETNEESGLETLAPKFLSPTIVGGTFSVLTCYCIAHFGMRGTLGVATIGCLVGGAVFLATAMTIRRALTNTLIERLYFPITAICFFLVPTLPDFLKFVPSCIALSMFFFYAAFYWSLIIAVGRDRKTASPRHFSASLLAPSVGICIGWGIASAYALAGGNLAHPFVLFFGWIVVYTIVLSIAPYATNTLLEMDLLSPEDARPKPDPIDRSGNSWEQACELIADTYKLSPREREVFGMLAHGRNVKFIKDSLFISENTAKTHKYRIYRKLEVSTHQELLDHVERIEQKLLQQRQER